MQPHVFRIISVSGLDNVFVVFADEASALEAIRRLSSGEGSYVTPVPDRRSSTRREESRLATLHLDQQQELTGRSANVSEDGVLLTAEGDLRLRLHINGKQYRGHLVRAFSTSATTGYAIALDEPIELDTSV